MDNSTETPGSTKCAACGASILRTTAQRTGGLCRPCRGGYRQAIEESRMNRDREREEDSRPFARYWSDLVHRVHGSENGFESLSLEAKKLFAMRCFLGSVHRGGLYSYFADMAEHFELAVEGLMEIGASQSAALLLEAKSL